jgi:hypothetical protein
MVDKMIIGCYHSPHMKKHIVIATLVLLSSVLPVKAETVTCRSEQYGGAVCGVETSVTVEHKVVETGASDNQMIKILTSLAGAALVASVLYKLTYKSYILG